MISTAKTLTSALMLCAFAIVPAYAQSFLDITSLTPGEATVGAFSGTIAGRITVEGQLFGTVSTPLDPKFLINGLNPGNVPDFPYSTTGGTSDQYAAAALYKPTQPLGDKIGYTKFRDPIGEEATLRLTFSPAITNPVFHVANLDGMKYDFSPSNPDSLTFLSGNPLSDATGEIDGISIASLANNIIKDVNPDTLSTDPFSDNRSAYGSVLIAGTFSVLEIELSDSPGAMTFGGDGGNFQISIVPEPSSLVLILCCAMGWQFRRQALRSHR